MSTVRDTRPLTGPEKRYGRNEWHQLLLYPRCCCAVPVEAMHTDVEDGWLARVLLYKL